MPNKPLKADGRTSSQPAPSCLSPVVGYHRLARCYLTALGFLMRPLLNGGTLGRQETLVVGMFDWYQPSASFNCPSCGRPLSDWQGKDGPNALLVWREGTAAPVDQRVDDDVRGPASTLVALRLPSEFVIHTTCCGRFLVEAICTTESETWVRTRLAGPADVDRIHFADPREVREARKRELSQRSAG